MTGRAGSKGFHFTGHGGNRREWERKEMLLFVQEKGNDQGGDLGSVPPTLSLCMPWAPQRVQDGLRPSL